MVQGYVRDPGQKILEGNASLTSVLAQAGSMTIDAGSYVIISRRGADGAIEQIRVPRRDIESGQAQNILLKDGDTVLVPKAETFFVNGQVRTPGSYTWDEGLTVERALTLAGGPTERAGSISIDARREDRDQEGEEDRPGPGQRHHPGRHPHLLVPSLRHDPRRAARSPRDGREPLRRHRADAADDGLGAGE